MYFKATLVSTILLASLANAADIKLSTPSGHNVESSMSTMPVREEIVAGAGTDLFIPNFVLDEEIELTPEEAQMRRISLGKILSHLSRALRDKKGLSDSSRARIFDEFMTTMTSGTGDQDTNISATPDSVTAPEAENTENNDVNYSVNDEGDTDSDVAPEETELRRGGRGGRGRGGRGRGRGRFGRGRGRFGRGRFGRGRRFGRFGGRGFGRFGRFGRFGGDGCGWNDDCGGDDCGSC
ncbi:hypothetical protein K7432_009730 [Basidiobolus ranarum]|uniref:Uncharacterized protein n=1 Tax=Basidiobolus ranarum TaxID=34480 RepID=A0ABR2WPT2_9FUNG